MEAAKLDTHAPSEPRQLVQGRGRFLDDLRLPGMLHCKFVRSVEAHAELAGVDTEAAMRSSDLLAVLTAADLEIESIPGQGRHGPPAPHMDRPPLALERVRYVGEPIAIVISRSAATAFDGAQAVHVHYEELPAVVEPLAAMDDTTLLFPDAGSNVVDRVVTSTGDAPEGEVEVTVTVGNQRVSPLALEPLGIVADPTAGRLRVWSGHQAPHRLRKQLAGLLSVSESEIRVTVPDVGGGFGAKGMFYPEYAVVAAAARRLGMPLKWVASRREELTGGTHGRAQRHRVTLRGSRQGDITHMDVEILADLGAYPHNASMIPAFTRFMATGPYRIDSITTTVTMVVTNTAPIGTYRGAGRPEASYALERAVDYFARRAGLDPIEVRRRNLIQDDAFPHSTPSGAVYDSGTYRSALDRAVDAVGLDQIRREQRLRRSGKTSMGVGVACYIERAGGPINEGEHAAVSLDDDGDLRVAVGAVDTGQGHARVWKSIAAEVFDVATANVRVVSGDTDLVADGVGTFASRSTQVCGSVVKRCAEALRENMRQLAAALLEADPRDLILSDGRFEVVDHSDTSVDLQTLRRRASEFGVDTEVSETWVPGAHTFPYGAHAAVVEVDGDTGDVSLKRALAVDDCGNVMDIVGAKGQVHGSLAQGIGQARYEAIRYDTNGQLLTSTLVDYLAPRASDLPMFETMHLNTPAPSNPLGAKGIGESGCIGFPAAFVAAVEDAISHQAMDSLDMPMQAETVWRSMGGHMIHDRSTQEGRSA